MPNEKMENLICNLTDKEKEKIKTNLNAFVANFGNLRIERVCNGKQKEFLIYYPAFSDSYIQYCYNLDYLNGWLYGCVQTINKIVTPNKN